MGYTLNRVWRRHDETQNQGRSETAYGGDTYAEAEGRARVWWGAAAKLEGAVMASTVVEIIDAAEQVVASLKDAGEGIPALVPAGGGPAREKWLNYLREVGTGADRVRRSSERLAALGTVELAEEAGTETLDACAARLGALVYRVDDMLRHGWAASGGDPVTRLEVRSSVNALMDGADVDGYLDLTTQGRIQIPPSTRDPDKVPVVVEAMLRVSAAMLNVCEAIEAHAVGKSPEPGLVPGR